MSTVEATTLSSLAPRLSSDYEHLKVGANDSSFSASGGRRQSRGRFSLARRELNNEVRIFYVRMANELVDLAQLEIPINLLYDRFDPPMEQAEPIDNRTA